MAGQMDEEVMLAAPRGAEIDRRDMLKVTAAGATALAATSLLGAGPAAAPVRRRRPDPIRQAVLILRPAPEGLMA
jgi:hypothetical protein